MNRIIIFCLLAFTFSGILLCKKKEEKGGGLLILGLLFQQNATAGCNVQSGFTICVPKGIAE
ncbi:MAG: hypothetical protein O9264_09260 [Leptospira sp.]|nr:hypothetical protein [Leptospira sp.]